MDLESDDLGKYKIYEPLLSDLKLTKRLAPWMIVISIYRRIVLVFVALFLHDHPLIQAISFLVSSLMVTCLLLHAMPYIDPFTNMLEVFNEIMIMFVGYFAMVYVGLDNV